MRDLTADDNIVINDGKAYIHRVFECGSQRFEPICHSGLQDWAQWWIRQSQLRPDIKLPPEAIRVFEEVSKLKPKAD